MNVIGANVAAGKWGVAESNIQALDKTIRDELKVKKVAVAVTSNPVQARLDAVNQRLQLIKADYAYIYEAMTRIDRASVKQSKALIAQLRLEIAQKLNLINARGVMDAIDAIDTEGAEEIAFTAQRLQTQNKTGAVSRGADPTVAASRRWAVPTFAGDPGQSRVGTTRPRRPLPDSP